MKKQLTRKKSAFSLIELSIVLIIIGLLIAGITGGASLIKGSELRSVMGEARAYSVAVNSFSSQFGTLPGDYNVAVTSIIGSTGNAFGDNNGKIEYCATGGCSATATVATASESAIAWYHLKAIGGADLPTNYIFASDAVAQSPGTNFPASKIKASGWSFDYNNTTGYNVVVLTGATTAGATTANTLVNGTVVSSGAITPTDALAIDTKIDDASANTTTGKVFGVGPSCYSASAYNVATTTKVCALAFRIDVNS